MEYNFEELRDIIVAHKMKYFESFKYVDDREQFLKDAKKELENELVDIDEDMIPILTELNKKGYYTTDCCSGHKEQIEKNGYYRAYISFEYKVPDNIPLYTKSKNYCYYWVGNSSKKTTVEEKENERKQLMNDLLEWAKNLKQNINTLKIKKTEDFG